MKKAIVFLANGFEEMEATGTVDILRRGGLQEEKQLFFLFFESVS